MVWKIGKKGTVLIRFDELQDFVRQTITQVVAALIEVSIFRKTEVFGKHDRLKTLATRSNRTAATSSKIPHPEEGSRIATRLQ